MTCRSPISPTPLIALCALILPPLGVAEPLLVDSMSTAASWVLTGHRVNYVLGRSELAAAREPARPGQAAVLKLTYDLDRRSWIGLQWRGGPLTGRPERLGLWVHGDNSRHQLSTHLEDAAGRCWKAPLGPIDWSGWKEVSIPVEPNAWTPLRRHGERESPVRFPVSLRELRVTKANDQKLLGQVAFSGLRAESRIAPVDRVQVKLRSPAPGQVSYRGEPIQLEAEWNNPHPEALDGTVEAVIEDWLGAEQRQGYGKLRLEAGKTRSASYALKLDRLGSYVVWLQFRHASGLAEARTRIAVSDKLSNEASRPSPQSPMGMGMYLARLKDEQLDLALRLGREAGIAWTREPLSMAHLQPEPNSWTWDPIRWVPGRSGSAVELGKSRPISVPSSPSLNRPCETGELTLRLRLRVDQFDASARWQVLAAKGEGPQRQFFVFWDVPVRRIGISFGDGRHGWSDVLASKTDWETGRWYEVVVTHRRADRQVRWWVDGQPSGLGATRDGASLIANDEALEIGRGLRCSLDELAIYDRSSDPAGLAAFQPVAFWTFDENSGHFAQDASGHGNRAIAAEPRHEQILAKTREQGIHTYHVIMGAPAWMASRPADGIERPWNIMPRTDAWSAAMEKLATRAGSQGVRVWEIWNEPNIEPFWSPQPDAREYFRVLEASYHAIKRADPEAVVLGCSLAGPHGPDHRPPYEFVEEVLKLGGGKCMDAISIHPYRQPRTPEESEYLEDLRAIGDLTERYGRRLPVWITEVGWPNDSAGSSEDSSARLLARSYLLALSAGVKNVAWYDYRDDGEDPSYNEHHFGILTHALTPKPAYFAYRTLATELAGMEFDRSVPLGTNASLLIFREGERRSAVAWAHRGTEQVALTGLNRDRVDTVELMGNVEPRACPEAVLITTLDEAPRIFRDVPPGLGALRPVEISPARLKLVAGQPGTLAVTLSNPFSRQVTFSIGGRSTSVAPKGLATVELAITPQEARAWEPPLWSCHAGPSLPLPAQVVVTEGRSEPVAVSPERLSRAKELPGSQEAHASDEVTVAFRIRAEGSTGTWIVPVSKWGEHRNWGVYLTPEKGELCFSATFERGWGEFSDFNSLHSVFDNRWHDVAVAYSAPDRELRFHVDGQMVKRFSLDLGKLRSNTAPVRVAQGCVDARQAPPKMAAEIEKVTVWSRALSAEEIASNRGAGSH